MKYDFYTRTLAACKLWLRKRALMALSAIAWHLDDWVHRQQVKLREEIEFRSVLPSAPEPAGDRLDLRKRGGGPISHARQPETFLEWEARKSGVAVITKKEARRRRERITASAFDRRFAT